MCYYIEKITKNKLRFKIIKHYKKRYNFINRKFNNLIYFKEEIQLDNENIKSLCKVLSTFKLNEEVNVLKNVGEWQYILFNNDNLNLQLNSSKMDCKYTSLIMNEDFTEYTDFIEKNG